MAELKQCPFCGVNGKPYLNQIGNEHTKIKGYDIGCDKCHFKKSSRVRIFSLQSCRDWAVRDWNLRAIDETFINKLHEIDDMEVPQAYENGYNAAIKMVKKEWRCDG